MCRRPCRSKAGILFLLSLFSLGCPRVYRSETIWHADGTVNRAIYQEWEATPEPVRRSQVWQRTTAAPKGWSGPISRLPVKNSGEAGPYFAAWGRFQSPQDIPMHFIRKAPEGARVPDSELVRDCSRIDYVFVREYRWRETLSDIVTLEEMRQAREQLADLLIAVGRDSLNQAFGQDYDATDLVNWCRTEGKSWLAEISDYAYLHAALQKGPSGLRAVADGMAEVCARHGLTLKARGKFLDDKDLVPVLRDFVIEKIARHVRRRKDGRPVDKKTAEAFLDELNSASEQAMDRVIGRNFGGKEKFEEHTIGLLVRIVGLHASALLWGEEFDYVLTVPGEVVETNGQILSGNKVRWQFEEWEAYPLGYIMECRSLLPDLEAQKDLLQNQPLADRETMLQFVALIADREPLREVLHECRKRKSMMPLYDYYEHTAPAKDEKEVQAVSRLLKLLKLPLQPDTGKPR
jgi:hypothetical protein